MSSPNAMIRAFNDSINSEWNLRVMWIAEHLGSRAPKNLISAHRKAHHGVHSPSARASRSFKASQDSIRPPLATRKADATRVMLAVDGRKQLEVLRVAKLAGPDPRFGDLGPLSASVVCFLHFIKTMTYSPFLQRSASCSLACDNMLGICRGGALPRLLHPSRSDPEGQAGQLYSGSEHSSRRTAPLERSPNVCLFASTAFTSAALVNVSGFAASSASAAREPT